MFWQDYSAAVAAFQQGDYRQAEKMCRRALRTNQSNLPALNLLTACLMVAGKFAEAKPFATKSAALDPRSDSTVYNLGLICMNLGQNREACEAFSTSLALNGKIPDTWNNRGVVLNNLEEFERAIADFDEAIRLNANYFPAYANKGKSLVALDRLDEARACYDRALTLNPAIAEARLGRARVASMQRRFANALADLDEALRANPGHVETMLERGNALRDLQRFAEAYQVYDKILGDNPRYAEGYNSRGLAHHLVKNFADAIADYGRAIALKSDYAEAFSNRSAALRETERLTEALADSEKALALKPDVAPSLVNRGAALYDLGRIPEALADYDKAVALAPEFPEAYLNRGVLHYDTGRLDDALADYLTASRLKEFSEPHFYTSLLLLGRGDLSNGFREYEHRKTTRDLSGNRLYNRSMWTGAEDLRGKAILLHHEQGLGDTIQMCRYAPMLERMGATVLLGPQKPLARLMSTLDGVAEIVDADAPSVPFDYHIPIMSLPLAFGTTLDAIPGSVPYLRAEPERIARWREKIGDHGFKIAICWQGSTTRLARGRSFPLAAFERVSKIPGVRLISIHKGAGESQLKDLPQGMFVETLGDDFDSGADAFLDTAAVMKCCDLVITCDTAITVLGGALGVPTWIMLKLVPHWFWMLDRPDSPWYPTLRLFRQKVYGDWSDPFREMETALAEKMGER